MTTAAHASHLSPAYPARAARGTAARLRAWQQAALDVYLRHEPRDFLTVATPGAGKTTYALRLAGELLDRRVVERVIVVAPTEHLKTQWAQAAAAVGISLDPEFSGSRAGWSSASWWWRRPSTSRPSGRRRPRWWASRWTRSSPVPRG